MVFSKQSRINEHIYLIDHPSTTADGLQTCFVNTAAGPSSPCVLVWPHFEHLSGGSICELLPGLAPAAAIAVLSCVLLTLTNSALSAISFTHLLFNLVFIMFLFSPNYISNEY